LAVFKGEKATVKFNLEEVVENERHGDCSDRTGSIVSDVSGLCELPDDNPNR
jgi:hypothetical protein